MSERSPFRAIGIDIGGSSVKAAALREDGSWCTAQGQLYARPDRVELNGAITGCLRELGVGEERHFATGVCVPGRRDAEGYTILESVNVPALNGLDLRELLDHPSPVTISDAEAAAVDVRRMRGDRGRLLLLALGTGVGACVLDGNEPLRISGAGPGHFGQLDVGLELDAPIGPDGGRGGLEAYIGAPALMARFGKTEEAIRAGLDTDRTPLRALTRAIRIAHAIYRPHVVCLAGGVGLLVRQHLPALDALIREDLTSVTARGWVLECAEDLFHAARGAAECARARANPT